MSIPNDSILNSVKKMVGISEDYDAFDEELKIHINNVIMTLSQLGVPVNEEAFITDSSASYADVFGNNLALGAIKEYIPLKVRMVFDSPTATNVSNALKDAIAETEWRIFMQEEVKALSEIGGDDSG